jgi:hypothetical protein
MEMLLIGPVNRYGCVASLLVMEILFGWVDAQPSGNFPAT